MWRLCRRCRPVVELSPTRCPRKGQHGTKKPPRSAQQAPQTPQKPPRRGSNRPQIDAKGFLEVIVAQRRARERLQQGPAAPKRVPKGPQTDPKSPQVQPKTGPKTLRGVVVGPLCPQAPLATILRPMCQPFRRFCWSPCSSVCASRCGFHGSGACSCKMDMLDRNAPKRRKNSAKKYPKPMENSPQTLQYQRGIEKKRLQNHLRSKRGPRRAQEGDFGAQVAELYDLRIL